jgi:hypothetical protein
MPKLKSEHELLTAVRKALDALDILHDQPAKEPGSAVSQSAPDIPALTVLKGGAPPLTAPQRELVSIFIEHLRSLPILTEEDSWNNDNHNLVYKILFQYFKRRYGHLHSGEDLWDKSLSREDADKFHRLMRNAGSPVHPHIARRKKLLALAVDKRRLMSSAENYQKGRRALGLRPDDEVAIRNKFTDMEKAGTIHA